jgi:CHRD domain
MPKPAIRLLAAVASAALLLSVLAGSVAARPVFVFTTNLTGAAEVPGPGDSDALGHAVIMVEPDNDRLCWIVNWHRVDGTVFAAHIHGPADAAHAAPVLIPLFMDETFGSKGINQGCVQSADIGSIIDAIVADPALYYVNVHSLPDFALGAIRGQLG